MAHGFMAPQRAVRQVSGISGTYEEKLAQVGLTTLVDRRARGDMIQTFKIMHQIDDIPVDTFFRVSGAQHNHATRVATDIGEDGTNVNNLNLEVPRCEKYLDLRTNFFSHRAVAPWNSLPPDVKLASSVNQFKNLYDDFKQIETLPFEMF